MFISLKFLKSLFSLTILIFIISCSSDDTITDDSSLQSSDDTEMPVDEPNTNDNNSDADNNMENPFISIWEISAADNTIVLPIYDGSNTVYDFTVDWGDGTIASVTSFDDADRSHTYANAGEKTVSITGTITGFNFFNVDDSNSLLKEITTWGDLHFGLDSGVFRDCINLTSLPDNAPNLDGITDMMFYFFKCESFVGPVKNWDVSNIQSFKNTFTQAEVFNEDISSWNVSSANSLVSTFSQAPLFNQDISSWDVSNVLDFSGLFASASSFNQDISSWDVSNATIMSSVFSSANSFNQNISSWDVSNVTIMTSMFRGNLAFNQDISNWDTSKVTRCLNFASSNAVLATENKPTFSSCTQ